MNRAEMIEADHSEALFFAVLHLGLRNVSTLQGYLKVVADDSAAQGVVGCAGRRSSLGGGTRSGAEASAARHGGQVDPFRHRYDSAVEEIRTIDARDWGSWSVTWRAARPKPGNVAGQQL
jgi:hypothetical protein